MADTPPKERFLDQQGLMGVLQRFHAVNDGPCILLCGRVCYRELQDLVKNALYGDPLGLVANPRTDVERCKISGVSVWLIQNTLASPDEMRILSHDVYLELLGKKPPTGPRVVR